MSAKKGKRSAIWGMLFAYLAISKILYWYNIILAALYQGNLMAMGEAVLMRLLTQDVPIISGVLIMFYMEKFYHLKISKLNKALNQVMAHIIAYLLFMGIVILYFWVMILFFDFFQNINWGENLIYTSIAYLIVVIVLEIKQHFKKKEMTEYIPILNESEKLTLLKTLLDNNVLTQEEYDSKKEKLLGS